MGLLLTAFMNWNQLMQITTGRCLEGKAWHIGPVSLCNKAAEDKAERGSIESSTDEKHECLKWLDSKKPRSVVYVCFGSLVSFADCQLKEIAKGLEASGQEFIWVFYNEKLVTEILRIGVPVGSEQWVLFVELSKKKEANVKREAIEKAVSRIMVGDEAEEMRSRAIELGQMAREGR
ncbi:hypothetical protein M0R45_007731 [Rubus argutus]|uniref:Uncharacterized protein n=1 Tax=Rubus argutus TaxID=59490 RepID=A0AAW1XZ29_RUBAR